MMNDDIINFILVSTLDFVSTFFLALFFPRTAIYIDFQANFNFSWLSSALACIIQQKSFVILKVTRIEIDIMNKGIS